MNALSLESRTDVQWARTNIDGARASTTIAEPSIRRRGAKVVVRVATLGANSPNGAFLEANGSVSG